VGVELIEMWGIVRPSTAGRVDMTVRAVMLAILGAILAPLILIAFLFADTGSLTDAVAIPPGSYRRSRSARSQSLAGLAKQSRFPSGSRIKKSVAPQGCSASVRTNGTPRPWYSRNSAFTPFTGM
jgi:hypothetical protein